MALGWISSHEGNKIKCKTKPTRKLDATYCRENIVRVTGEASEATRVDDTVGVILVASQVVTGSKVTSSCGVRHDISG